VAGTLRSGNPIVMVMYGPAGGAREGEAQILREHPRYATYHAPNDKILVFLGHKVAVSSPDFTAADACQRLAGAAG
jgi:hypothetical protein